MKAIIVHRWDGTPQSDWYPWLKKELERKGWKVTVPEMPNTAEPEMNSWVEHLRKVVGIPHEKTYFIGHSIGCQTIMRYDAALPTGVKVGGIILVAGWIKLRNLESKEAEEIARPWLESPINFEKVKEKTNHMTVFLSDNDKYVDCKEHKHLFKEKLNAKIIVEKKKGHFTAGEGILEIPEVVQELEDMMRKS